jgi:RND family efflux transporter MFP subunit
MTMLTKQTLTRTLIAAAVIVVVIVGWRFASGRNIPDKKAEKLPPPVTLVTAQTRDLPLLFSAQGHVVALNQIDVRPLVTGTIRSVHFHEGDPVARGQLLFELDATEANAQLRHATAQLGQVQAQLSDAQRDYGRSKELLKQEFISSAAVATSGSKVESLQAQVRAARADVDTAQVAFDHTRIVSPINGQAGALVVHPGSLAQQNAAVPLVTLMQSDPIGVEFSLPESALQAILAARALAPVAVTLENPAGAPINGTLSFVNNTVNTDTGTINLKASFANAAKGLWPGTFSRVTVMAGFDKGAVVLPPQAILEGAGGRFVYVLGADGKVRKQPVTQLRLQDRMAVVTGLASGTRVVLEGNQNVRDGAAVRVADQTSFVPGTTSATQQAGK